MLSDRVSFAHFCLCVYPAEWEHPEYIGGAGGPELQDRVPTVPASRATGVSPTAGRERRGTSTASEHRGTPGQTGGHCHLTGRENVHTAHTEREYPCHGFIYCGIIRICDCSIFVVFKIINYIITHHERFSFPTDTKNQCIYKYILSNKQKSENPRKLAPM